MFTPEEKMHLFNRLPSLELSYEPKLHKKVYSSVYYIIPKGPKALVWYTYWQDQNVCLLIRLNERGNYSDIQYYNSTFSNQLALGTIIYGTHFLLHHRPYFSCEQLYYYKGICVQKKPYAMRLALMADMFDQHVGQTAHTTNSLVVGLPVMTETYEEALAVSNDLPYKTYGIAAPMPVRQVPMPLEKQAPVRLVPMPLEKQAPMPVPLERPQSLNKAIFKVKADLIADIYHLYTAKDILHSTALVPTYKSSVFLNSLFRKIKENSNLDLLEESDDEDEFENTSLDKFVDLEKTIIMECVYLKRFQKWQPVKVMKDLKYR